VHDGREQPHVVVHRQPRDQARLRVRAEAQVPEVGVVEQLPVAQHDSPGRVGRPRRVLQQHGGAGRRGYRRARAVHPANEPAGALATHREHGGRAVQGGNDLENARHEVLAGDDGRRLEVVEVVPQFLAAISRIQRGHHAAGPGDREEGRDDGTGVGKHDHGWGPRLTDHRLQHSGQRLRPVAKLDEGQCGVVGADGHPRREPAAEIVEGVGEILPRHDASRCSTRVTSEPTVSK
jgi:hypothetical protein